VHLEAPSRIGHRLRKALAGDPGATGDLFLEDFEKAVDAALKPEDTWRQAAAPGPDRDHRGAPCFRHGTRQIRRQTFEDPIHTRYHDEEFFRATAAPLHKVGVDTAQRIRHVREADLDPRGSDADAHAGKTCIARGLDGPCRDLGLAGQPSLIKHRRRGLRAPAHGPGAGPRAQDDGAAIGRGGGQVGGGAGGGQPGAQRLGRRAQRRRLFGRRLPPLEQSRTSRADHVHLGSL